MCQGRIGEDLCIKSYLDDMNFVVKLFARNAQTIAQCFLTLAGGANLHLNFSRCAIISLVNGNADALILLRSLETNGSVSTSLSIPNSLVYMLDLKHLVRAGRLLSPGWRSVW